MSESAGGSEVMVVVSKLKSYIKAKGMNTASNVPPVLSNILRHHCDQAMENARKDHRKTVMDRDFSPPATY